MILHKWNVTLVDFRTTIQGYSIFDILIRYKFNRQRCKSNILFFTKKNIFNKILLIFSLSIFFHFLFFQGKDVPSGSTPLTTAGGAVITAERSNFIQVTSEAGSAFVTRFDILASNGVIHAIDTVI